MKQRQEKRSDIEKALHLRVKKITDKLAITDRSDIAETANREITKLLQDHDMAWQQAIKKDCPQDIWHDVKENYKKSRV